MYVYMYRLTDKTTYKIIRAYYWESEIDLLFYITVTFTGISRTLCFQAAEDDTSM